MLFGRALQSEMCQLLKEKEAAMEMKEFKATDVSYGDDFVIITLENGWRLQVSNSVFEEWVVAKEKLMARAKGGTSCDS